MSEFDMYDEASKIWGNILKDVDFSKGVSGAKAPRITSHEILSIADDAIDTMSYDSITNLIQELSKFIDFWGDSRNTAPLGSLSIQMRENGIKRAKELIPKLTRAKDIKCYDLHIEEMRNASSEGEFERLYEYFTSLDGYSNAYEMALYCKKQYQYLRYNRFVEEMQRASTEIDFEKLVHDFNSLEGYSNTNELAHYCKTKYQHLRYSRLFKEMKQAKTSYQYHNLSINFNAIRDYKNAAFLAQECQRIAERIPRIRRRKSQGILVLQLLLTVSYFYAYIYTDIIIRLRIIVIDLLPFNVVNRLPFIVFDFLPFTVFCLIIGLLGWLVYRRYVRVVQWTFWILGAAIVANTVFRQNVDVTGTLLSNLVASFVSAAIGIIVINILERIKPTPTA